MTQEELLAEWWGAGGPTILKNAMSLVASPKRPMDRVAQDAPIHTVPTPNPVALAVADLLDRCAAARDRCARAQAGMAEVHRQVRVELARLDGEAAAAAERAAWTWTDAALLALGTGNAAVAAWFLWAAAGG